MALLARKGGEYMEWPARPRYRAAAPTLGARGLVALATTRRVGIKAWAA